MIKAETNFESPLGTVYVEGDDKGISQIKLFDKEELIEAEVPEILQEAVKQLKAYFSGELRKFNLKLNPSGTDFQKEVWNTLAEIPYGSSRTYQQIADQIGNPKAIRAVAAANGKNPLWIVIPCHRVIGKDGALTGYAGGIWRKKWLLEHESGLTQPSLF